MACILRTPLVVANWKMNGSQHLCELFSDQLQDFPKVDIWLAPPFVYLATLKSFSRLMSVVSMGAQNVHHEHSGAFTGDVSAAMVADVGAKFAIIGHSERRTLHHENDKIVSWKLQTCKDAGIVPLICVGESLEQRQIGSAQSVVQEQLRSLSDERELIEMERVVIAYEPIWAIGTGNTASPCDAEEMHRSIRDYLGSVGCKLRILYGGSVNPDNAEELINQPNIDGFLVGGASLEPSSFNAICSAVNGN